MKRTLILNHLSVQSDGCICADKENGKSALLLFFRTVQAAINDHGFERYLVSDKEFWSISPSPDCTLEDFIKSRQRTEQRWFWELYRLASKSALDFFSEELVERIISYSPVIRELGVQSESLGCAACVKGFVAVSFATDRFWDQTSISIDWYDGERKISPQEYDLGSIIYNISAPDHIKIVLKYFPSEKQKITKEDWELQLPTVFPQESFWSWFDGLDYSVQKSLFKVACTIQERKWLARKNSSFQRLVGNELCEIRCWPDGGATIRAYVKVESANRVIFFNGSGKKDQKSEIEMACKLYKTYKK